LDVVAFALTSNKIVLHNLKFDEKVTDFIILNNKKASSNSTSQVQDGITSIAFSTGTALPLMAVGTLSGAILIFDLDKKHLHCIMGEGGSDIMSHSQKVLSLHFLAGKPVLLSSGEDNSIKQWLFNDTLDTLPTLLRFRQGHSMPPTLVRHYDKNSGNAHHQSSDNQGGTKLLSCSSLDKTFRVFSAHKDEQSFEMSQKNVARRAKRIKLTDSSQLKLNAVKDIAFCSLRENDWCNVVTAHENETCAYTWRLGKHALGEFTLQPPLSELIHMQRALENKLQRGQGMRIDTHTDAQKLMQKHLLSPVTSVAISNCGHYALIGCKNGRMDRYNLQSGFHRGSFYRYTRQGGQDSTLLNIHLAHECSITGIECDVFNKEIFTAGEDQTLRVWAFSLKQLRKQRRNVSKDDLLIYEEAFDRPIAKLANHKHSSLLAISLSSQSSMNSNSGGGDDGDSSANEIPEILLYDTWAKKVVRRFNKGGKTNKSNKLVHCEGSKINDLCFSEDGKWLLTCGSDHKIAIWDVPGSQVLQVLQVPEGSACVSLSLSPGKTMLATAHENCKGIYLWSNKLVYSPGSNLALSHSSKPIKVDLPLLNPTFNESDEEDDNMEEDNKEEDLLDVHMDVNEDGGVAVTTVRPLGGLEGEDSLVTLSQLPRSHWHGLMYQEQIKERNKPKEVVKKPEHAPFFLPTTTNSLDSSATMVPGNQPSFDLDAKIPGWDDADEEKGVSSKEKEATKINRDFQGLTDGSLFMKAVQRAEERGGRDYSGAVQQLKEMSPAQIHAEIQSFESLGESLEKEDVQRLKSVIQFMKTQIERQTDFELIQAFLQVFLRMHMKSLMGHPALAKEALGLKESVEGSWAQVDDKLQRVTCMLAHFLRLQT
jgi:U3 small nucleolar RNA-associated protein 21